VPRVANGVISWMLKQYPGIGITDDTLTPVVAECDDGRLNDIQGRHVSETDVMRALDEASTGPVAEGSVGAGTGMISYGFKGGIGTASRRLPAANGGFTIGVLVNANHGRRPELTMGGVPVGQRYGAANPIQPVAGRGIRAPFTPPAKEPAATPKGRSLSSLPPMRRWTVGNSPASENEPH
jgi:D-aminopeptidase